jgi:GWxTD domain-containing protein
MQDAMRLTIIFIIFYLLSCFNFLFSFQKNIQFSDQTPSDSTKILLKDDKSDYDFIEIIKEGNFYLDNGLYDDAIKKFEEANKIKETSNAYRGLGLAYFERAKEISQMMTTPFRAMRKIKFFESSVENFLKGLKIEPNSLEIRYHLAEAFIFRDHPETYELAKTLLNQIIQVDKKYRDALILLSVVYRYLKQPEKSQEMLEEYIKIKEENSRALYYLSQLAIENGNYREAEKYLMTSLDRLKDESAVAEILENIEPLFTEKDKTEYQESKDKGKFFKKFWIEKDPEPETSVNERLIEHFRRVAFANKNFTTSSIHGKYDDRGKIYIKYGEPDSKYISGGSMNIYSNESWMYYWQVGNYKDGMFFDFANKGGEGFVLIGDLREATYGEGMNELTYRDLYVERVELDEKHYGRVARAKDEIMLLNEIIDFRDRKDIMNKSIPQEAFLYYLDSRPLDIRISSASFRGTNGSTRYELYYSIPIEELKFEEDAKNIKSKLSELVLVKNLDNERVFQNNREYDIIYDKNKKKGKSLYIGQVNMEISPQNKENLAYLKLKSELSQRLGLAYHELRNRNYTDTTLMISDIEFSYDITPAKEKDEFTKNGLRIIPHTGEVLNKKENIFIYFELYNLDIDTDGDGQYIIDYIVQKRSPADLKKQKYYDTFGNEIVNKRVGKKEMITTSRIEKTKLNNTFNYLSVDMRGLSDGVYDLTIKVTDLVSKKSASSEYAFVLVEE